MFNHGFSDEKPIGEIIQSYLGLEIKGQALNKVLEKMAYCYDESYGNLQPTYAQYSSFHLCNKFSYLIRRVIDLYQLDDEKVKKSKDFFWKLSDALRTIRLAKKASPDYQINEPKIVEIKKSQIYNQIRPEVKEVEIVTRVTLYKYRDDGIYIDSYAYFEKQDLVVDFSKIAGDYEDENFITIRAENVGVLYNKLQVPQNNQSELLIQISKRFNGVDCFRNYETYLTQNNIPFVYNVRHG
jgi:hypothetical protein